MGSEAHYDARGPWDDEDHVELLQYRRRARVQEYTYDTEMRYFGRRVRVRHMEDFIAQDLGL